MVATEQTERKYVVTTRAVELISYIRGHKSLFNPGQGFSSVQAALFRKNDTARIFVPEEEIVTNAQHLPGKHVLEIVLEDSDTIAEKGLQALCDILPNVKDSEEVAAILKFDLLYVLRVVSYGASVKSTDFVHDNNIGIMNMVHEELEVAGAPVIAAVEAMRDYVVSRMSDNELIASTIACFDVVLDFMRV